MFPSLLFQERWSTGRTLLPGSLLTLHGIADSLSAWPLYDFKAATLAHPFAATLQDKVCESVKKAR